MRPTKLFNVCSSKEDKNTKNHFFTKLWFLQDLSTFLNVIVNPFARYIPQHFISDPGSDAITEIHL